VCVCALVEPFATRVRVLVLQHPKEHDHVLGSAGLLAQCLPWVRLAVGLSWPSLAAAADDPKVEPRRWAVIFPDGEERGSVREAGGIAYRLVGPRGEDATPHGLDGLVALDGTWSHAKSLWWRNPWLLKLARLTLLPREPSIYGRLRPEPKREYVSTLEAVADALVLTGEPEATRGALRRVFRTLVQRVRDASPPG
jgi:hypothetical protein